MTNWKLLFVSKLILLLISIDEVTASHLKADSSLIFGEVIGGNSKNVIVFRANESPLDHRRIVPVIDNKFSFKMSNLVIEAYMIVQEESFLEGGMRPLIIFPDDIVFVKLPVSERYDEHIIEGGPLNNKYHQYLEDLNTQFSVREDTIDKLWQQADTNQADIAQVSAQDSLLQSDMLQWQLKYIVQQPSLVTFFLLKQLVWNDVIDYELYDISEHAIVFENLYPDHPYTREIGDFLYARQHLVFDRRFIDFSADDLAGNQVQIGEMLAPKATLINFWASWCGPCIRATRTMIPIYREFNARGFDIINVARERKDTHALQTLLEREKYPWTNNLVELDTKYGIWKLYGINNATGLMVLIDDDRHILAVNPTAEEVRQILSDLER